MYSDVYVIKSSILKGNFQIFFVGQFCLLLLVGRTITPTLCQHRGATLALTHQRLHCCQIYTRAIRLRDYHIYTQESGFIDKQLKYAG